MADQQQGAGVGPRLTPLPPEEWNDLLRQVLENAPGGTERPMNIFTTLSRHPDLFAAFLGFGAYFLRSGTLDARDRELVILRTAHNCTSPYEWHQHVPIAQGVGVTDAEIAALSGSIADQSWSPGDRHLLTAADELHASHTVSDGTWNALAAALDERQLIELLMLVGQYQMVAGTLNALRVQVE